MKGLKILLILLSLFFVAVILVNAANITILAFSRGFGGDHVAAYQGQGFALIVIAIAAAEAAVGLAIVVTVFRTRRHSDIDRLTMLKN